MFKEYYPICDRESKKFIIVQDDKDGKFAILKTTPASIIESLKGVNAECNLPSIYEYGEDYIIEETIEGTKLLDIIEERLLSFVEIKSIISDISVALKELHRNKICHLDISPENIVFNGRNYILIDFGASRKSGEAVAKLSYGTFEFCSPEHFGFDSFSEESDIFSLGRVLQYLLEHSTILKKEVFDDVINNALKVDKNQRTHSVEEFYKNFEFVCQQHTHLSSNNVILNKEYKPFLGGYVLTEDMLNSLSTICDLEDFIHKNNDNFEKLGVVDYFERILKNKGLKKSDVIQRAEIERTYGYQLLNGTKKPSRDKLIQLCIGAKLSFEESQMALKRTGFAPLYPKNKRDCILIYAIKTESSVSETDRLLYRFKESLLNDE